MQEEIIECHDIIDSEGHEDCFEIDAPETINATTNTMGRGGGAIMEVSAWIYKKI